MSKAPTQLLSKVRYGTLGSSAVPPDKVLLLESGSRDEPLAAAREPPASGSCDESNPDDLPLVIVAIGVQTYYWAELCREFPCCMNACIDVRDAFNKEFREDTLGDGFDSSVRSRMMEKATWHPVKAAARTILDWFRLLIVVCNHGKHRSLSLAYELSQELKCELVSPRDRTRSDTRDPKGFISYLKHRLDQHHKHFGASPHPIIGAWVCKVNFDGVQWAKEANEQFSDMYSDPLSLHDLREGDLVVQTRSKHKCDEGWLIGTKIRGDEVVPNRWFPCTSVNPLQDSHFRFNFIHSLKSQWIRESRPSGFTLGVGSEFVE